MPVTKEQEIIEAVLNQVEDSGYQFHEKEALEEVKKILSKAVEEEREATKLELETLLDAVQSEDSRFLDEQGIYLHSYIGHDGFFYDDEALKGARVILKHLLKENNVEKK